MKLGIIAVQQKLSDSHGTLKMHLFLRTNASQAYQNSYLIVYLRIKAYQRIIAYQSVPKRIKAYHSVS